MLRSVRTLIVIAFVLGPCAGLTWVRAQEAPQSQPETQTTSQPTSQPAPESQPAPTETTTSEITAEDIQARIAQIEGAADLSATVKTEAEGLYRQTLDQITAAKNWAAKTAEFQKGREEAPQLVERLRDELARATERAASQPAAEVPADRTLEQITQDLASAKAAVTARQQETSQLETEAENRKTRTMELPDALISAKKRLDATKTDLAAAPAAGLTPEVVTARRTLLLAQKRALEQEVKAAEEELRFYDARTEVLATRRALARLQVSAAQAAVTILEDAASRLRQAEIERQQQAAQEEVQRAPKSIREFSEGTKTLADRLATVEPLIRPAAEQADAARQRTTDLDKKFTSLAKQIEQPALRDTLGPEMRRIRSDLINLQGYERTLRQHRAELVQVDEQLTQLDREQRDLLGEREQRVAEELDKVREANPHAQLKRLEPLIRDALQRRSDVLASLLKVYQAYQAALLDLIVAESGLLDQVGKFTEFIDQHVLWIRSAAPLQQMQLPADFQEVLQYARSLLVVLWGDVRASAAGYVLLAVTVAILVVLRSRMRRRLLAIRERVTRIYTDAYALTLEALALSFLLAVPWALLLWALGVRLPYIVDAREEGVYNLAYAAGAGLRAVGVLVLILGFLRRAFRPAGLAEAHFRWQAAGLRVVRVNLVWLKPVLAICAFVVAGSERFGMDLWRDSVGRLAFMAGTLALAVFAWRILRPSCGFPANWLQKHPAGWASKLRYVWYGLAVLIPVALAVTAAVGYYYTALQLTKYFFRSILLVVGLMILHALLVRWLFVAQRKLAIEQARKKRAALLEAKSDDQKSADQPPPLDEKQFDLVTIGDQTRKLLRSLVSFALVIGLWLTWSDLLPALSFMQNIHLWSYTVAAAGGNGAAAGASAATVQYITLAHLVVAIIISIVTVVLARNIPGLLEITLLKRLPMDAGGRFAVTTLARYAIVIVGVVSAFSAIGIGWSKVQWLVTAMLVGLGFGLQEIFANFVSGIMLLFERPIRIGDTVTVGGVSGTVSRIRIRATTITDWDRKELVIPNKEFITGQVVNWTLSDPIQRIIIPVGIAYGSDTKKAEEVLHRVAQDEPLVLNDPAPRVLFLGFGDSTLNFELRVYIATIDHYLTVKHNLHMNIDQAFRAASVEIAFPQQDIHIRSIEAPLQILSRRGAPGAPPS